MNRLYASLFCLAAFAGLVSCTVISKKVRSEAEPPMAFTTLVERADELAGRTVILGGYILETRNVEAETVIEVLQVPMRIGEEPDIKDSSEGRFRIYQNGFLDPEVYSRDRAITVAGDIIGSGSKAIGDDRIPYLEIRSREIYLWPDPREQPYPYPYPIWPYPYYWLRHPFYRHHYWYW